MVCRRRLKQSYVNKPTIYCWHTKLCFHIQFEQSAGISHYRAIAHAHYLASLSTLILDSQASLQVALSEGVSDLSSGSHLLRVASQPLASQSSKAN